MIFRQITHDDLGCASYLVGDEHAGVAAVGDPKLLVAGSHGHGAMRSALIGSVSRYLVDHAPCAVLVVPRHRAIELVAGDAVSTTTAP